MEEMRNIASQVIKRNKKESKHSQIRKINKGEEKIDRSNNMSRNLQVVGRIYNQKLFGNKWTIYWCK